MFQRIANKLSDLDLDLLLDPHEIEDYIEKTG